MFLRFQLIVVHLKASRILSIATVWCRIISYQHTEQMRVLICDAYVGMANLTSCSIAVTSAALHLTVLHRVISDRDLGYS